MEAAFDITVGEILLYLVAGLVIGLLARLLVPGKHHMSITATIVLGVVSAIIGGLIWNAIFPDNDGIAWIGSIIVAVVLVMVYSRLAARRGA
ncbi:MAG: GlsB/YeaQ/YmgE family stress response membrane protein [Actinomycetota bacterium]|nr:GlsB/YeaQ/YmgE family stress response membrane protein [Actinomycetota bacterium]